MRALFFCATLLAPLVATAQLTPYTLPDERTADDFEITDVAIASGKSGVLYAAASSREIFRLAGETSAALSFQFDGTEWKEMTSIFRVGNEKGISSIDLASDAQGGLHASFYTNSGVSYGYLAPGSSAWSRESIPDFLGAPNSDTRRARSGTSIAVEDTPAGPVPHITFTGNVGETSGTYQGRYAFRNTDGTWTVELITVGDQVVSGEKPVISLGTLPATSFSFLIRRGPVIAYYEDGEYLMTQREVSTFGGDGTPTWTTPVKIADAPLAPIELDFTIADGVVHAVCNGTSGSITQGALYYRREVISDGGIFDTISEIREEVTLGAQELTFDAATTQALSIAVAPNGNPQVAVTLPFDDFDDRRRYSTLRYQRDTNSWTRDSIITSNSAGIPTVSDIAFDALSRPIAILARGLKCTRHIRPR